MERHGRSGIPEEEAVLWRRHIGDNDREARALLIDRYLSTAQRIAASLFANRINDVIDFNDYLQYARVGLIEAIDRYDPAREASFTTFATYRIRGAVLNGIEHASEQAAQHTQRQRAMRERVKSARDGVADSPDSFTAMVDIAISLALGYMLEESGVWRPGGEDRAADPYQSYEMKRTVERVATVVEALPERERLIIRYHYFEHREFIEIAEMLKVSKGRVSQLHARSLKLIREAYQALNKLDFKV